MMFELRSLILQPGLCITSDTPNILQLTWCPFGFLDGFQVLYSKAIEALIATAHTAQPQCRTSDTFSLLWLELAGNQWKAE